MAQQKTPHHIQQALSDHFLSHLIDSEKDYFYEWMPEIAPAGTRIRDIKQFGSLLPQLPKEHRVLRMKLSFPELSKLRLKPAEWRIISETLPLMHEDTRHLFLAAFQKTMWKNRSPEKIKAKIAALKKRLAKSKTDYADSDTFFAHSCENAIRKF